MLIIRFKNYTLANFPTIQIQKFARYFTKLIIGPKSNQQQQFLPSCPQIFFAARPVAQFRRKTIKIRGEMIK
jgi:hypothetical protein